MVTTYSEQLSEMFSAWAAGDTTRIIEIARETALNFDADNDSLAQVFLDNIRAQRKKISSDGNDHTPPGIDENGCMDDDLSGFTSIERAETYSDTRE